MEKLQPSSFAFKPHWLQPCPAHSRCSLSAAALLFGCACSPACPGSSAQSYLQPGLQTFCQTSWSQAGMHWWELNSGKCIGNAWRQLSCKFFVKSLTQSSLKSLERVTMTPREKSLLYSRGIRKAGEEKKEEKWLFQISVLPITLTLSSLQSFNASSSPLQPSLLCTVNSLPARTHVGIQGSTEANQLDLSPLQQDDTTETTIR